MDYRECSEYILMTNLRTFYKISILKFSKLAVLKVATLILGAIHKLHRQASGEGGGWPNVYATA